MPDPVTLDQPTQNVIPAAPAPAAQTSAPAPDASAPDPRAGLGGASPDMSPLDGLAKPSGGAPQLANQHRTLNTVLKYVALGLAGSAAGMGEKRPGEAAAAGVKTGMGLVQQGKENVRADQAQANQTAETQSRIKFQNVQAAEAAARAHMYDQQLHQMPQEFQDNHNAKTASFMKEMQDLGITPTIMADNHGHGANTALEQLTESHGGVPHMFVLNLGDKLVGYDLSQLTDNAGIRDQVNKISEIQGKGSNAYTPARWGMIGKEGREQITQQALSFFMPMPTKDNADSLLQQYKNYQQTYEQNPNADKSISAKLDDTVKMLEKSRETFVKQKGEEGASVAAAELPIKAATAGAEQTARLNADLKTADVENVAMRLVEGFEDPTQMSKRGRTYDAQLAAADRYSMQKYGKHFDMAQAQSDFKYASSPQNQNTLKYLNSLTGNPVTQTKGNLDLLLEKSNKINRSNFPALNDAAAWLKLETGDPAIVGYKAVAMDVADQFAKIMQGGGAGGATSDAKIKQGVEMFNSGFTKRQVQETVTTVNEMLGARKRELIGNNRYLMRQYGGASAPSAAPGTTPSTGSKYTPPPGAPTAVGAGGHTLVFDNNRWVDSQTGQPFQQ